MANKSKQHDEQVQSTETIVRDFRKLSQLDFELEFFSTLHERYPEYVEVLRVLGNCLTQKKQYREGLDIDRRLVQLKPDDPLAHYNLACSYALLRRSDYALRALEKSFQLGYRDFRYLRKDRDLDSIRNDPRFKKLLRQFERR